MGLDLDENSISIDLECRDAGFYYEDQEVTDMNKATCIRVMEPEIIKEEQSDCSKGFGADGESDALDISLVKVGWNFNGNFEEQVMPSSYFTKKSFLKTNDENINDEFFVVEFVSDIF